MSKDRPLGICVLRADDDKGWMVSVCHGPGTREVLERFATREEAAEFAIAERDRRRQPGQLEPVLHMPDDCPCYQE